MMQPSDCTFLELITLAGGLLALAKQAYDNPRYNEEGYKELMRLLALFATDRRITAKGRLDLMIAVELLRKKVEAHAH